MANAFSKCGPKLEEADLQETEGVLGVKIPASLRKHYLECNGGRPKKHVFLDADENDFEINSFRRIKHKAPGEPLIEDTYKNLVKVKKIVPERLLPFAADSGGDLYCIDLQRGTIWFWAADSYEPGTPESAATEIAPSFDAFLAGLVSEKEAYGS